MRKKHANIIRGLTGALSASALVVGVPGVASAAGISGTPFIYYDASVGGTPTPANGSSGGAGPFAPASSVNITNSRHNLGSKNTLGGNHTPSVLGAADASGVRPVIGTNQICVFCHTPHGFNTTQSGPLWNKQVGLSGASYAVYNAGSNNSSTLDADVPVIGSVSLACLSCHDGTQAMDNMVNAPGSAGMVSLDATLASGAANSTLGVSQGYTWGGFGTMSQGGTGPGATVLTGTSGSHAISGANVVKAGDTPAKEGILLGTDLSNDHPISVQYCGGGIDSAANGANSSVNAAAVANGTCRDRLFNLPTVAMLNGGLRFWVDVPVIVDQEAVDAGASTIGGTSNYPITRNPDIIEVYVNDSNTTVAASTAVTTGGAGVAGDATGRGFIASSSTNPASKFPGWGVRTKQDIMLFTNNAGVTGPSVECASCHDPHTPNNGTFLRVSNAGSGLCLSCHVK